QDQAELSLADERGKMERELVRRELMLGDWRRCHVEEPPDDLVSISVLREADVILVRPLTRSGPILSVVVPGKFVGGFGHQSLLSAEVEATGPHRSRQLLPGLRVIVTGVSVGR